MSLRQASASRAHSRTQLAAELRRPSPPLSKVRVTTEIEGMIILILIIILLLPRNASSKCRSFPEHHDIFLKVDATADAA
jgi:hypothetical protein